MTSRAGRPAAWADTVGVPPLPREDLGIKGKRSTALIGSVRPSGSGVEVYVGAAKLTRAGVVAVAGVCAILAGVLVAWMAWAAW